MDQIKNLLIVGVGGQGTILASDIITEAALLSGYDVKKSEIHGMSQRGGSVFSHIRVGKKVYSPVIPKGETDILISLEEMEILRWLKFLNNKTKIILSKNRILPATVTDYPNGIIDEVKKKFDEVMLVDPDEMKEKTGNIKFNNVVLLGITSNFLDFADESWEKSIKKLVSEGTFDKNWEAFNLGKKYITKI